MSEEAQDNQLLALISLRIKRERLRQNNTQEEVMGRIDADVRLLQRVEAESFASSNPRIRSILKVARALQFDLAELFGAATAEELKALSTEKYHERVRHRKKDDLG